MINLLDKGTGESYDTQGYSKARRRFKLRGHRQALIGASKAGVIAFGASYAAGLLSATSHTDTTGTGTAHAQYNLGAYKDTGYATGNNMNPLDTFINSTTNVHARGTLHLTLTSNTDATSVIPGNLTPTELNARYTSVGTDIYWNTALPTAYKTQLL